MRLFLLTFETRHYTFQAVGTTKAEAWEALERLWAEWCRQGEADPTLLEEDREDVWVMELVPGGTYVDSSPWPQPSGGTR